jgi:hypothetical protein
MRHGLLWVAALGAIVGCGSSIDGASNATLDGGTDASGGASGSGGNGGAGGAITHDAATDAAKGGSGGVAGSSSHDAATDAAKEGTGGVAGSSSNDGAAPDSPDKDVEADATTSDSSVSTDADADLPMSCEPDAGGCPTGSTCACLGGPGPTTHCRCAKQCSSPSECAAPYGLCGCGSAGPALCVSSCECFCG